MLGSMMFLSRSGTNRCLLGHCGVSGPLLCLRATVVSHCPWVTVVSLDQCGTVLMVAGVRNV